MKRIGCSAIRNTRDSGLIRDDSREGYGFDRGGRHVDEDRRRVIDPVIALIVHQVHVDVVTAV